MVMVIADLVNAQRSHAGPGTLKCNRDGLPALAGASGYARSGENAKTRAAGRSGTTVLGRRVITEGSREVRDPSEAG